jgi:PiT family inorganic phosphate transporter
MGVGLGNSMMSPGHSFGEGVNWAKAGEVGLSLVVSPIVGFICTALLLLLTKLLVKQPALYRAPEPGKAPPFWIRGLLVLTCTGVSFTHGSNDGQKGMGLIVLILVGILPGSYALKMNQDPTSIHDIVVASQAATLAFEKHASRTVLATAGAEDELSRFLKAGRKRNDQTFAALAMKGKEISRRLGNLNSFTDLPENERRGLRTDFYLVAASIGKLVKTGEITDPAEKKAGAEFQATLDKSTKFIPGWVKFAVAGALGLGTMIGWKRIVVTVGEKIGKEHLTYAQGASAELVAMTTIGAADLLGLPVSTTHVLSSGVAGAMAANHSGLQTQTLRNLLLAWVLTLPVCIFLGASIFSFALYLLLHVLGLK